MYMILVITATRTFYLRQILSKRTGTCRASLNEIKCSSAQPSIQIDPNPALMDEMTTVRILGLSPYQEVTVVTTMKLVDVPFISHAMYRADEHGHVDFTKHPSYGGSYTGNIMVILICITLISFHCTWYMLYKKILTINYDVYICLHTYCAYVIQNVH